MGCFFRNAATVDSRIRATICLIFLFVGVITEEVTAVAAMVAAAMVAAAMVAAATVAATVDGTSLVHAMMMIEK